MVGYKKWCSDQAYDIKGHSLNILNVKDGSLDTGIDNVSKVISSHYCNPKEIANLLNRLGKVKSANFIKTKLPKGKKIRSGDIGEILATEYIEEETSFTVPIRKLRWKDHREMALRGDDVIGIELPSKNKKVRFLKCEVKSRESLAAATISEARAALKDNLSRPAPHALSFIASRLREGGKDKLADIIEEALLVDGIKLQQIEHSIFTFSGNDPLDILRNALTSYTGKVSQGWVGLRIEKHQSFISAVYKKAV